MFSTATKHIQLIAEMKCIIIAVQLSPLQNNTKCHHSTL